MRDGVTLWRRLSLGGRKPQISPAARSHSCRCITIPGSLVQVHWGGCRYNALNFHPNGYNGYPIACPWGWDMVYLLWVRFYLVTAILCAILYGGRVITPCIFSTLLYHYWIVRLPTLRQVMYCHATNRYQAINNVSHITQETYSSQPVIDCFTAQTCAARGSSVPRREPLKKSEPVAKQCSRRFGIE